MSTRKILLSLLLVLSSFDAHSLGDWTQRLHSLTPEMLAGGVWNGSRWIVVGNHGFVATSTDGANWSTRTVAREPNLLSIAQGDTQTLALDDVGRIWSSRDGLAWQVADTLTGPGWSRIQRIGSRFIVTTVGLSAVDSIPLASTDGKNWHRLAHWPDLTFPPEVYGDSSRMVGTLNCHLFTSVGDGPWTFTQLQACARTVIKDGNTWVAAGDSGHIWTSPDALTWTTRPTGLKTGLWAIAHHAGTWIAVGDTGKIFSSTDGNTWIERIVGTRHPYRFYWSRNLPAVSWDSTGGWVVATNLDAPELLTSKDGIAWTRHQLAGGFIHQSEVNPKDVMPISNGTSTLIVRKNGAIGRRDAQQQWTFVNDEFPRYNLGSIVHNNGVWLALGTGMDSSVLFRSTDGIHWTWRRIPGEETLTLHAFNGLFLTFGRHGNNYYSTDGLDWKGRFGPELSIVADNGTRLVGAVLGYTQLATSTDGLNWSWPSNPAPATFVAVEDLQWTGRLFVAIAGNSIILTSPDGVTWNYHEAPGEPVGDLRSIAANGRQILVLSESAILLSNDGTDWTHRRRPPNVGDRIVTALDTLFLAGQGSLGVSSSPDGVNWTPFPYSAELNAFRGHATSAFRHIGDTVYALAASTGMLRATADGSTWWEEDLGGNQINDIAYGGGMVVAVGWNSTIFSRPTDLPDPPEAGIHLRPDRGPRDVRMVRNGRLLSFTFPEDALASGELYDPRGRHLMAGTRRGATVEFDLRAYPAGVFFVRLGQGAESVSRLIGLP